MHTAGRTWSKWTEVTCAEFDVLETPAVVASCPASCTCEGKWQPSRFSAQPSDPLLARALQQPVRCEAPTQSSMTWAPSPLSSPDERMGRAHAASGRTRGPQGGAR